MSMRIRMLNTVLLLWAAQLALYCWMLGPSSMGLYFSVLAVALVANGIRMR